MEIVCLARQPCLPLFASTTHSLACSLCAELSSPPVFLQFYRDTLFSLSLSVLGAAGRGGSGRLFKGGNFYYSSDGCSSSLICHSYSLSLSFPSSTSTPCVNILLLRPSPLHLGQALFNPQAQRLLPRTRSSPKSLGEPRNSFTLLSLALRYNAEARCKFTRNIDGV